MSLFKRGITKIGLGLLDLGILALGLFFLFLQVRPTDSITIVVVDSLTLFAIVVILYLSVVVVTAILLSGMPGESLPSKLAKSFVSTLCIISLFDWLLIPALFLCGYQMPVSARDTLIVISLIRWTLRIWVGRRLGLGGAGA